jgi:hypothetical protein
MGFGRRFKGLGKFVKKGVKLAALAGLGPAGGVGSILTSRLKTMGEKKRTLDAARSMRPDAFKIKGAYGAPRAPAWQKNTAPLKAAKTIQLKGSGAALLASTEGARRDRVRTASTQRLDNIRSTELKIGKLTAGQKEDLAEQFKREGGGSPAEFRAFLAARL